MKSLDQKRKENEANAYRREEEHRAERRAIEAKERERAKKDLDRKRYDEMAIAKHTQKKLEEMKLAEAKQDAIVKELESKKSLADQQQLAQHAQLHKPPQP
jgi:hypothetical protein